MGCSYQDKVNAACVAAIRGEGVPPRQLRRSKALQCLIRGIRYQDGFAEELHGDPETPEVTRALNARAIMSNRVPEIRDPDHFPYCFWHPDVPDEEALRQLLDRYPDNALLPYQIGRACAVGGYTSLYNDLDILPDVAIAEEARENIESGQAIYQAIMDQPIRYAYMDDYNRCLRDQPRSGAHLNGDTCVRSILNQRFPFNRVPLSRVPVFDITEDQGMDVEGTSLYPPPVDPKAVRLLYCPLPADLPTVDKDLLILMAAWTGNVDRYIRLRRPRMIRGELQCIIRGIYHHPLFAKWWQEEGLQGLGEDVKWFSEHIVPAVNARCIMNNDLSWLSDATPESQLPKMFWHPQPAHQLSYLALVRRRPSMTAQVARACMHAGYKDTFNKIDWQPEKWLYINSRRIKDTYYQESIERKAREMGIDCEEEFMDVLSNDVDWDQEFPMIMLEQEWPPQNHVGNHSLTLWREITTEHMGYVYSESATVGSTVGEVLLHACWADPSTRPAPPSMELNLHDVYREAPPPKPQSPPRGGSPRRRRGGPQIIKFR